MNAFVPVSAVIHPGKHKGIDDVISEANDVFGGTLGLWCLSALVLDIFS